MRIEGAIKKWNDDRGFGFIESHQGGPEVFVHIKAFVACAGRPEVGQRVNFEVETTGDGRVRAARVEFVGVACREMRSRSDSPAPWGKASLFALSAFLVFVAVVTVVGKVPGWVGGLYLGASLLCFVVYALDKSAAKAERWRVREFTLLTLGLFGGWPGAIVAQQFLRHKSRKASFRAKFWLTVIANVLGFIILSSPTLPL